MFKSKLALAVALGLGMSSPLWAADGGIEARLAALEARVQAAEARATAQLCFAAGHQATAIYLASQNSRMP